MLLTRGRVQSDDAAWHRIASTGGFQLATVIQRGVHFALKLVFPQTRFLDLYLIHDIDAEAAPTVREFAPVSIFASDSLVRTNRNPGI